LGTKKRKKRATESPIGQLLQSQNMKESEKSNNRKGKKKKGSAKN
jgi:hypothetical protein